MISKNEFFNPSKLSSSDKAAATDATAREIVSAEVADREKKTERLKVLRLERESRLPAPTAKPKRGRLSSSSKKPK